MNLEVDDNGEDKDCCKQVHQVWQILAVESLTQATHLVLTSCQQVKQSNHRTFKLRT